jgi:hypothetical protein
LIAHLPASPSRIGEKGANLTGWFFFYGTLMDRDVLARVLARPVRDDELVPAILSGFRRVGSPGVVYPRLVPDQAARVCGLALAAPAPHDLVRLHWFEDGEYAATSAQIRLVDGRIVAAGYFSAFDGVLPADARDWCPMTWTTRDKPSYLARCDGWMDGCPAPEASDPFVHAVLGSWTTRAA